MAEYWLGKTRKCVTADRGTLYDSGGPTGSYGNDELEYFVLQHPGKTVYNFYVETWEVTDFDDDSSAYDYIDVWSSVENDENSWDFVARLGGEEYNIGNYDTWKNFVIGRPYVKFCWATSLTGTTSTGFRIDWGIQDAIGTADLELDQDSEDIYSGTEVEVVQCSESCPKVPDISDIDWQTNGLGETAASTDSLLSETFQTDPGNVQFPEGVTPMGYLSASSGPSDNDPVIIRNILKENNYTKTGVPQMPFSFSSYAPFTLRQRPKPYVIREKED
tara:strand:- start:20731 stop:21555 length:825 start_codon:yes stop_codon:yes gene_type:complete